MKPLRRTISGGFYSQWREPEPAEPQPDDDSVIRARAEFQSLCKQHEETLYQLNAPLRRIRAEVEAKNAELNAMIADSGEGETDG